MRKDLLEALVGKVIKVDRGGPNSRIGKLLAVSDDFFTLLTEEDGIVYYLKHHTKSITENTRTNLNFELEIPKGFKYKTSTCFEELLESLRYQWVQINRGGPEKIQGVLHEANNDFVTVVSNEEIIRISTFHINNLSYDNKLGGRKKENKTDEKNDQKDSKKDGKSNSKDDK